MLRAAAAPATESDTIQPGEPSAAAGAPAATSAVPPLPPVIKVVPLPKPRAAATQAEQPKPTPPKPVVGRPLDLIGDPSWYRFSSFRSFVEELQAKPAATNAVLLVGHTTLRVATMKNLDAPASGAEISAMQGLVREALEAGAAGVSTGLYYEPARAAPTEEVIEVCRPLSARKALYCTHMRDEAGGVMDSLEETFRIGRELGVPVVVSHHKVVGAPNHGRSRETLPFIGERMKSQAIGLDCYPYCASSTILSYERTLVASKVLVTWSVPHPEFGGMDLADIAARMGVDAKAAVELGVKTIGEPTAMFLGRDVDFMRRVSQESDLQVVPCTGIYTYDYLPQFFLNRSPDQIADLFVGDIEEGIQGTEIRAGFIKVAADEPGVNANIEKVHRAAAKASVQIGRAHV